MNNMYLIIRKDSSWDWERENFIAVYSYRDVCEEACKLLNKSVKKNEDYNREYYVKPVLYPMNLEMFNNIIKDCLEEEE